MKIIEQIDAAIREKDAEIEKLREALLEQWARARTYTEEKT